ncbi:DUF2231 domain-containing protein, partial [Hydrogenimonas sp.]
FVHFVVALPVLALFSQMTYLATQDKTYSKAATRILAFSLLVSFFAVYGGLVDAKKIVEEGFILKNGLNVLDGHKTFGFIVVAALLATTWLKWIAVAKDSLTLEKLSLLFIIVTIVVALYQGNNGGSIVYKYAGGIDGKIVTQRVEERQ